MTHWTSAGSTAGPEESYDEYEILFETLDQLQAAVLEHREEPATGLLLHKLADHTCHQLFSEEAILSAAGFPGIAQRQAEDRDLTHQVAEYIARYELGEVSISMEFVEGLRNWLRAHIEATDRAVVPWLEQQQMS